LEMAT